MISGRHRPISSAPSVRPMEKALGSSSPPATARPWRFIWKKSRLRSRPTRMRSFFSIRRDGMSRRSFLSQTTSPSCRCRRNRLSSTRWKISGSSCATTGSPTGSSNLMTTSSITVALPGKSSSICRGKSYPSEPETGPIGHDQRDLVLKPISTQEPSGPSMPSGRRSGTSAISSSLQNAKTTSPPPDMDSAERPAL